MPLTGQIYSLEDMRNVYDCISYTYTAPTSELFGWTPIELYVNGALKPEPYIRSICEQMANQGFVYRCQSGSYSKVSGGLRP